MRSAIKIRQRAKRQNVAWVTLRHPAAKLDRPLAFSKLEQCARVEIAHVHKQRLDRIKLCEQRPSLLHAPVVKQFARLHDPMVQIPRRSILIVAITVILDRLQNVQRILRAKRVALLQIETMMQRVARAAVILQRGKVASRAEPALGKILIFLGDQAHQQFVGAGEAPHFAVKSRKLQTALRVVFVHRRRTRRIIRRLLDVVPIHAADGAIIIEIMILRKRHDLSAFLFFAQRAHPFFFVRYAACAALRLAAFPHRAKQLVQILAAEIIDAVAEAARKLRFSVLVTKRL